MQAIRPYIRFGYQQVKVGEKAFSWQHTLVLNLLKPSARLRVQRHKFGFPLEVYAYWGRQKLKKGFSLYERY